MDINTKAIELTHEGDMVKDWLKKNKITQEEMAVRMGFKERQGFLHHINKEALSYEFKERLRANGVDIFNVRKTPTSEQKNYSLIPFYNIDVFASPEKTFDDNPETPSYFLSVPGFSDCSYALPVCGNSMAPKFKNGDIIAVKEINNKAIILYGEAYLVITEEYRIVKIIRKHPSDESKLLLVSENDEYDPVEILRDEVKKLYLVKGKIEINQL
jgi:SOS-response transcriptional repressor LexA